jgi:arylformamidase
VEILDISAPLISGRVPLYPGDTPLSVERVQQHSPGTPNVSRLTCSTHCGTHVDAPVHFLPGGAGVEAVPVDSLIGPAVVVDASFSPGHLDAATIAELDLPADAERVLLRTSNAQYWQPWRFVDNFVALTADGARALVDHGVRLVGIDYLSIAPYDDPEPTHRVLLEAGVTIVEMLDLRAAAPGHWQLTCLPLLIPDVDGAPARAVLTR